MQPVRFIDVLPVHEKESPSIFPEPALEKGTAVGSVIVLALAEIGSCVTIFTNPL